MDGQWLIWLGLGLAAGVVEIFTLSLVFVMIAGGALAAAAVAALTGNLVLAVLAFAATTGLLLAAVRPSLLRYAQRSGPASLTGTSALIDRDAVVLEPVDESGGLVKLAGEVWTARSSATSASSGPLEVGSRVRVVAIEGATAMVIPLPPRAALPDGASSLDDGPETV